MNFQAPERDAANSAAPYGYQQQLRAMHHVMEITTSSGSSVYDEDTITVMDTTNHSASTPHFPSHLHAPEVSSHAQMAHCAPYASCHSPYLSPMGNSSPQHSFTTSSSTCSPPDTTQVEDDAMVDAAMHESGILTNDHFGMDTALLHEMAELLACSREDTAQWNHFHLESPSLVFPAPASMEPDHTAQSVATATVTAPSPFLPHGAGWHNSSPVVPSAGDTEMESDAQPVAGSEMEERETELLNRQLKFLEAQRDFLEYKTALANATTSALSAQELEEREQAAENKERLTVAQLQQKMLANVAREQLENLRYMELLLLQSPLNHYRMTLMTPMESFIHLTKDPTERRATLQTLRDSKIEAVYNYINFQSRNIDLERQFFYLDTFEKFGKFYTVDFSISKLDDTTVDDVVHTIYHHFASTSDIISEILGSVENREYFDGIEGYFLHARFVDRINLPPKRHRDDRRFVVQESNTVHYLKRIGETVVMMCDYIDKDDLHPYRTSGRIRKDKTVGMIVEPFVDLQGNKSVIMKRFSFIKHHFKNIPSTPDLVQALSTKVILWGQAVRFCLAGRTKNKNQPQRPPQVSTQLLERAEKVTEMMATTASNPSARR